MVDNLKKIYYQIAPSKINGVGLIAIRSIPKNTLLFKATNENVKYYKFEELRKKNIPLSVIKVIKKYYAHDKNGIEIPDNFFSNTHFTIVSYINHSNNSNVYFNFDTMSYYTKRRIKKNEELTINYSENDYCSDCIDFKIK